MAKLANVVADCLDQHVAHGASCTLGFSGGLDSSVLLALLAPHHASGRIVLTAVHVHHGLQPAAEAWAGHCEATCKRFGVPCVIERVTVTEQRSHGIEAAARRARYAAFAKHKADHLLLAHHQDDLAETVLLQVMRGAGIRGFAGMQAVSAFLPFQSLLRPLLGVPRAALRDYAATAGLTWVEDPSNSDQSLRRNWVRESLLPAITVHVPQAQNALVRTAALHAEAQQLLDELADADLAAWRGGGPLPMAVLAPLSSHRQRNVLRRYLARLNLPVPTEAQLAQIQSQLLHAHESAQMSVHCGAWVARRFDGALHITGPDMPALMERPWNGERHVALSSGCGSLEFNRVTGDGIALRLLEQSGWTIGPRREGARLKLSAGTPSRTMKHLFQEHAIPPWQRLRWPMVFCGDDLVWMADVGVALAFRARADEEGVKPVWLARN